MGSTGPTEPTGPAGRTGPAAEPLLELRGLSVEFGRAEGPVRVVDGVDLEIHAGETLGLVGTSGSGKTTTALALLGLLPAHGRASGCAFWRGRDLLVAGSDEIRSIRGAQIALVPQDPTAALHPLMRVDRQVAEAVRAHTPELGRAAARDRAVELLTRTGLSPERLRHAGYPFEWSGGMRQRALLAMALAHSPALLIADEPTTALDATTRAGILALLRRIREETGMAMLLITHDIAVVAAMADRVAVMRTGRIIEAGAVATVCRAPDDPHTAALVAAMEPAMGAVRGPAERSRAPVRRRRTALGGGGNPEHSPMPARPILRVNELTVRYRIRNRRHRRGSWFTAVDGASLEVRPSETVCLVGESGAGKSSLARAIVRLQETSAGRIHLEDRDITDLRGSALRAVRRDIQIVFQDPYSTLNPRRRIGPTVTEPLRIHGLCTRTDAPDQAVRLLEAVGLPADHAHRFPFQLSGGERQRVAIARALALNPKVVVLDEPVSSLDTPTRSEIVRLLAELQQGRGMAYLLIAHDLRFVRSIAHRVAVMRGGHLLETGTTAAVFERPIHAFTRSLVAAADDAPPASY